MATNLECGGLPPLPVVGLRRCDFRDLDARAIPPYLFEMRRNASLRAHLSLRGFLAILFILCLLISPLCSARCAAQACALPNSNGTSAGCHESSDNPDQTGWKATSTTAKCTNREILFTETRHDNLLTSSNQSSPVPPALFALSFLPTNVTHASENLGELIVPHLAPPPSVLPLRL
jgi:hypothetical protein